MKFTTLIATSLLLSLSSFVSAANDFVDQSMDAAVEKIYVNADGEIVYPLEFHWGRLAVKEKDAAKARTCGGHVDASGRLGKRAPTCQYGYAIACDAYNPNPCCPVETPLCCTGGSTVCCGDGQFCQGNSTCCNIGQVGCGEACCEYGEVCCGPNCCGAGFTCGTGNTCVPPPGYTDSSTSDSSSSSESYDGYTRSPPIYTTDTSSNPYGYNPSYTPVTNTSAGPPVCTANCTTTTTTTTNTNISIVGGVLGAFCALVIAAAAWLWWRKRHAEKQYAEVCAANGITPGEYKPAPAPEPTPDTSYTPVKEPPTTTPAPPATTYTPAPAPPTTTTGGY